MTNRIEALVEQVRALSAEEQVILLCALQDLVGRAPVGWEADWIGECEDRLSAFDRGETKAVDFDDAISDLRRKFGTA